MRRLQGQENTVLASIRLFPDHYLSETQVSWCNEHCHYFHRYTVQKLQRNFDLQPLTLTWLANSISIHLIISGRLGRESTHFISSCHLLEKGRYECLRFLRGWAGSWSCLIFAGFCPYAANKCAFTSHFCATDCTSSAGFCLWYESSWVNSARYSWA